MKNRYCKRRDILMEIKEYSSCKLCLVSFNIPKLCETIKLLAARRGISFEDKHQELVDEYKNKLRSKKLERILK